MEHADYLVDILDYRGRVIGQKPRQAVDKQVDIFHGVHVVVVTPTGQLAVSLIPQREELPNLYAGMLGSTMATIRRSGETAVEAAIRGLKRELLIEQAELKLIRNGMVTLEDGRRNYLTAFLVRAEQPLLYRRLNIGELVMIAPDSIEVAMTVNRGQFSPTLKAIWPHLKKRRLVV